MSRIESLLSARLFLQPQMADYWIYFISDMSGRLSLYRMRYGSSLPEPLLPPHIALQNPHLLESYSFHVLPELKKVLVIIDQDGDEKYQPMLIPWEGGFPEPAFGDFFAASRVQMTRCDPAKNIVYLSAESTQEPVTRVYQANVQEGSLQELGRSAWEPLATGFSPDHDRVVLIDHYGYGDHPLYLWERGREAMQPLYGLPWEARSPGQEVPLTNFKDARLLIEEGVVLLVTALFADTNSVALIRLGEPQQIEPVAVNGLEHSGVGELVGLRHLFADRYLLEFNIDGCSWAYQARLDLAAPALNVEYVLVGSADLAGGKLANGVLESIHYDEETDSFALAFSSAASPVQIYTLETDRRTLTQHTHERLLGLPLEWLSPGEPAGFTSFDGRQIPARLYLPAEALGFTGPRPLVYYLHGGPHGQERPDFTWFSMPLIQFLTLNGFAVFVPNVRGSTGYGLEFAGQVDRDWGGNDRLDHVHAMTQVLPGDPRLDVARAGVIGRSYGGYMTLMLAGRHPELWSAAVDLFGPYDLLTFIERIPETWKPYFHEFLGDPQQEQDRAFLIERSPRTYLDDLACPLLVIQGQNDPRVVAAESSDLVANLQAQGKQVAFLLMENEGHDVLKYENRVSVHRRILDFFKQHLQMEQESAHA